MVRRGSSGRRGRKSGLRPWFSEPQSLWKASSPDSKENGNLPSPEKDPGMPASWAETQGWEEDG